MPVSLSLLAGAGWQFFDNSGTPLSGGKLYTYVAGTTTPATTYTDATGVQANTNPIILNSAGRVPYEIWLTSGTNYKFILKTSTDTLLGTYDNIRSAATSLDGTGTNNAVTYFNATGAFSSSPNFTFNDSTNALTVAGNISGSNISASGTLAVTGTTTLTGNTTVVGTIASTGGITSATPAVTQAPGDSSTKIATTAFVQSVAQSSKIQPLTASVSGGNLNISLAPTSFNFRSTTLKDGTVSTISNGSTITLQVPSGATLGTISGQRARLVVLAINNAGTMILGVTNLAGGLQLDESNTIGTTTTGSAANVVYSSVVISSSPGVAYRVAGFIDITETTAGTWATDPIVVQGIGGQVLNGIQSFSNAASGSVTLPSGTIIKWGQVGITIGTAGTVTFPVSFPYSCASVVITVNYGGGSAYVPAIMPNPTASTFVYGWNNWGSLGNGYGANLFYVATGY